MDKEKSSRKKASTRKPKRHSKRKGDALSERNLATQPDEIERLNQEMGSNFGRVRSVLKGQESADEEPETSEGRVQALFESAAQGIVVADARGRIRQVNAAAERMFGYDRGEMLGRPVEMLLSESLRKMHRQHLAGYFSQPRSRPMGIGVDLTGRRSDGKVFPVEVSLSYLKSREGLMAVAFVSDITMRKAAEETSRRLAAIVESSDDAIFSKTLEGVITSWNRGAERTYGYAAGEVIGRSASLLIPTDRGDELSEVLTRIRKGEQLQHFETERVRKDGKRIAVSLTISPVRNPKGKIVSASVIARDITKKKQALEILSHLSKVFMEAMDSIVIVDTKGRITNLNAETERAYGWARDELLGQPLQILMAPEWQEVCRKRLVHCLGGDVIRNVEGERCNIAGERIPVLLTFSPLTDEKGKLTSVAVLAKDITKLRRAEDILRRNQQELRNLSARLMESEEEERRKVARELHDSFGPQLASLNMKVSEVARQLSTQPRLVEGLEEIGIQVGNLAKAIHDLSRSLHPSALFQLGLRSALDAECARFSKQYGIAVDYSAETAAPSIPDSVALCLYRVAQESLQNIRKYAQAKRASVKLTGEDHEIVMVVRDFGKGFDVSSVRGSGGIGLVSMRERVRLVGGSLLLNSEPDKGSQVVVRIPIGGI